MSDISICAKLACSSIYKPIDDAEFDNLYTVRNTICGVKTTDDTTYICFQGTINIGGWEENFDLDMIQHPVLGGLHCGFYSNLPFILSKINLNNKNIVVTGHSKGAGEASIFAALLKLNGYSVSKTILFACPKSGDKSFSNWMRKNISGISFRNTPINLSFIGDPVTEVPLSPYEKVYIQTNIFNPPKTFIKKFINSEWHNADLYYIGCKNM